MRAPLPFFGRLFGLIGCRIDLPPQSAAPSSDAGDVDETRAHVEDAGERALGPDAAVERDAGVLETLGDAGQGDAEIDVPSCEPAMSFPRPMATSFSVEGQTAWRHDEGHQYGFFHTFDGLIACDGAEARKVHVLLPRDYETSNARYPVLYVNDGQTAFFTDNNVGKTWDMAAVLSESVRCHDVEKMIVVAPHPIDRGREYTHAGTGPSCCGVDVYSDYLATCLRSFIDRNYRTRTTRDDTAILGSSHGGLAAFWIATDHPLVFGRAAAFSPSFWAGLADGDPLVDSTLWAHASSAITDLTTRPRLYIDWGLVRTGGNHNSVIEAKATVRGREMMQLLEPIYGHTGELLSVEDVLGEHEEISWGRRLPVVLKFLFPRP